MHETRALLYVPSLILLGWEGGYGRISQPFAACVSMFMGVCVLADMIAVCHGDVVVLCLAVHLMYGVCSMYVGDTLPATTCVSSSLSLSFPLSLSLSFSLSIPSSLSLSLSPSPSPSLSFSLSLYLSPPLSVSFHSLVPLSLTHTHYTHTHTHTCTVANWQQ